MRRRPEETPRLGGGEAGEPRRFEIGRAAVGGLDQALDLVGTHRRQSEAQMDRGEQPRLDRLVGVADHRLERRDHVADHIFRRVVQQDRKPRPPVEARRARARDGLDQQRVLRDREDMRAAVWPFQRATRASPCAMSSISMSSGEGSSRSSRRPDSMRCQARGAALRTCRLGSRAVFAGIAVYFAASFGQAVVTVAVDQMVVDHAGRLHEGVDDRRPDELESAADDSFDIARESGVSAGTCLMLRKRFTFGSPSTKSHSSAEKPGPFSITSR